MRRKLKGVKAPVPQLQPRKHGWTRDHLIKLVKKISRKMLSQLDRENDLQEPLAKAMAVADLSLKLTTGCHNIFSKEFYQFSTEVKSLQSDIMDAIRSVKKVVTLPELRNLQLLIEPKAVISNRCLRSAFVSFLTEFLFECSDMDSVPKFLSQILDVINRGSNSSKNDVLFKKKYIEEEVDCILNMSALTKQIVLDLLPDDDFDKDFTDAYLEQLEESDDSGSDEDDDDSQLQEDIQLRNGTFGSMDSFYEAESIGDFAPFVSHPSTIMTEENVSSSPLTTSDRLNSGSEQFQPNNCDTVKLESKVHTEYGACKNQYLAVQDACDKTSMLAYNLIGHMLEEFVTIEGLDLNSSKSLYLSGNHCVEDVEGIESLREICNRFVSSNLWIRDGMRDNEEIRNRFVSGNLAKAALRNALPTANTEEENDDVYGDFEDLETGEKHENYQTDNAFAATTHKGDDLEAEERRLKKFALLAKFDSQFDDDDIGSPEEDTGNETEGKFRCGQANESRFGQVKGGD